MSNLIYPSAVAVFLSIAATPAQADSASGVFGTNGKEFKPSQVAAFRSGTDTLAVLSSDPVNREAIVTSGDALYGIVNDPAVRGKNFIIFTVNGKGLVTMNATMDGAQNIDSSGVMFGAQGSLIAKCSENTQEHVACHVTSEAKAKWNVDITFDSKVSAMAGR